MTALLGTFVRVQTMADMTPRVVFDMQCTLAEFASLGIEAGTPFGIARISGKASVAPLAEPEPAAEKPGPLCVLACRWCKDPEFWEFSNSHSEELARGFILRVCEVDSRKDLDRSARARSLFLEHIWDRFMGWRTAQ